MLAAGGGLIKRFDRGCWLLFAEVEAGGRLALGDCVR